MHLCWNCMVANLNQQAMELRCISAKMKNQVTGNARKDIVRVLDLSDWMLVSSKGSGTNNLRPKLCEIVSSLVGPPFSSSPYVAQASDTDAHFGP